MLNNSLDVTSSSEAVWGNITDFSSFFVLSIKVCHKPGYTQCKCNILSKKKPSHSSNCEVKSFPIITFKKLTFWIYFNNDNATSLCIEFIIFCIGLIKPQTSNHMIQESNNVLKAGKAGCTPSGRHTQHPLHSKQIRGVLRSCLFFKRNLICKMSLCTALSLPISLFPSLFLISLEVGLPSVTKRTSIDWFQQGYWWLHNLGTETQKGWPLLRSARQPSQQGCLHLLAWERSSCRIKAHLPTHWSLSWKQYSSPSLAAS